MASVTDTVASLLPPPDIVENQDDGLEDAMIEDESEKPNVSEDDAIEEESEKNEHEDENIEASGSEEEDDEGPAVKSSPESSSGEGSKKEDCEKSEEGEDENEGEDEEEDDEEESDEEEPPPAVPSRRSARSAQSTARFAELNPFFEQELQYVIRMTSEWPKHDPREKRPSSEEATEGAGAEAVQEADEKAIKPKKKPKTEKNSDAGNEGGKKKKSSKKKKDKNAPSGPKSAYILFSVDKRAELTAQMPGRSFAEYASGVGSAWSSIESSEKAKYEALAVEDKARHQKELEIYKDMLADMDEDELAAYNAENNIGSGDGEANDDKPKKKKSKKSNGEKTLSKAKGESENKPLSKPRIGSGKMKKKAAPAPKVEDDEPEPEEPENYGSSEDEIESEVPAMVKAPSLKELSKDDEENKDENDENFATPAASPSTSPSKDRPLASAPSSKNEASTTPDKDAFVFAKPAVPSKPKQSKVDVVPEKKQPKKGFVTPTSGSAGAAPSGASKKKSGFSAPKKVH